jgi:hypothetical protein
MSHPHGKKLSVPAYDGQTKTLFVMEGNKLAMLVSPGHGPKPRRFANPHAALAWCLANHASMIFTASLVSPSQN